MKKRVAVIYGGRSGEHEISLRSAQSIINALDPEKYKVLHYLISKEGKWSPRPIVPEPNGNPEIDVVFPALHGTFGEDGTLQGLLELAGLPYVGAGVLASSVSMDKEVMKRLAKERGLPVVDYMIFSSSELKDSEGICSKFEFPVFVKPANLGSSVGISKAHNCVELKSALELAASFDRKIIVERGIEGREFECAVLGNEDPKASVPCEILPSREFYDYDDKYLLEKAGTVIPADLSPEKTAELQRLAVECYRAVECEGLARVDFLLETSSNRLFINEINTLPGFTSISMYPKMWEHSGLPMPKLVDRLIELALERHAAKQHLRYSK
ncbi:MAG TPA: D-alanine--D-alanine ligase family protein [Bryobacteraceae bacterium]|jgi:D-alanine-D-alanine ligase|nr:D-alanine--D-alanine ligase family protein [Bryobacteraceae bacterium]